MWLIGPTGKFLRKINPIKYTFKFHSDGVVLLHFNFERTRSLNNHNCFESDFLKMYGKGSGKLLPREGDMRPFPYGTIFN